jgi:superfamily I DNA and/or RNA helicase
LEVAIIQEILRHAPNLEENSVAIITPHRAQRTQLKTSLEDYATPIRVIDTVEKLQGGECETIIVSATASDPLAIAQNVEFILDLNRSNVAFSRVKERLVVVCAASLLNFIPADLEQYEKTLLWKALRSLCTQPLVELSIAGHTAEILTINKEVEL